MILRIALFVMMAAGLLGFGAVAWVSAHPRTAPAEQTKPVTVTVLALVHDVRAGTLLKADDLAARDMLPADAGADAILDTPDVRRDILGGMVRRALAAGAPLRTGDVMHPGEHGFLAAVLRPGMRAVAVAVDSVSGAAGLIWPGDSVDVILTQTLDDTHLPASRRIAGETVLQNARVIAIDQLLVQGAQPDSPDMKSPKTVTLEMTSSEAERVQVATRIGRLSLALRSAEQPADALVDTPKPPEPVWAGDVSNALRGGAPTQQPAAVVLRVYNGSADGKEFRY
ncbi:MAG: Flp pilus assembly protein CpaB [Acetobacteraceae bacterium]|nr:Flp pilus assembly protein CpaB [Acetobacteraceae bacterium]